MLFLTIVQKQPAAFIITLTHVCMFSYDHYDCTVLFSTIKE